MLIRKRIDGLLVMCTDTHDGLFEQLRSNSRIFPWWSWTGAPRCRTATAFRITPSAAIYLATRHLIELGHRQIAIITGPAR